MTARLPAALLLALAATGCACQWDSAGLRWTTFGGFLHSKSEINPVAWDVSQRDRVPCWDPAKPGRHTDAATGVVTAYEHAPPNNVAILTDEVNPPTDSRMADDLTIRHAVCAREDKFDADLLAAEAASGESNLLGVTILQVTGLPMCDDAKGRFVHQWACSDGSVIEVARGGSRKHRVAGLTAALEKVTEARRAPPDSSAVLMALPGWADTAGSMAR